MKAWIKNNWQLLSTMLVMVVLLAVLIGLKAIPGGYDPNFHMARIHTLANNLRAGHFPNPIGFEYLGGMGYGVGFFYGNFWLYPFAILVALGIRVFYVYILFLLCLYVGAMLAIYSLVKEITKKPNLSLLAIPLYVLNNYYLNVIFGRAAIGEAFAMVFVPIVLLYMKRLIDGEKGAAPKLGLAMAGLLVSHLLTFALMIAVLGFVFLFNIKSFIKNPIKINWLIKAALIGIGISAVYLFPLVEQLSYQSFTDTSRSEDGILTLPVSSVNLLKSLDPRSLTWLMQGFLGVGLTWISLIAIIFCLIKFTKLNSFVQSLFVVGIIFSIPIYSSNIVGFLSRKLPAINTLQAIWRLNVIVLPIYVLLIITAISLVSFKWEKWLVGISAVLILVSFGFSSRNVLKFVRSRYQVVRVDFQTNYGISRAEYLPKGFSSKYPNAAHMSLEQIMSKQEGVKVKENNHHEMVLSVAGNKESVTVPKIYYKGYVYQVKTGNKTSGWHDLKESSDGLGIVKLNKSKATKEIIVRYHMTIMAWISWIVTIATAAWLFIKRKTIFK